MARPGKGQWTLVEKRMWDDPAFIELSPDARLIFIWSWTSFGAAICGLGEVSPRQLERALAPASSPATRQRLADALRELARKPMVLYDDVAEVLWVVARAGNANTSGTTRIRMQREFEACPDSPLRARFHKRYGEELDLPPLPNRR